MIYFIRPWFFLLGLFLPLYYLIHMRKRSGVRVANKHLYIRILLAIIVLTAIAQPQIAVPTRRQNVIFLADLSQSVRPDFEEEMADFIGKALAERGENDRAGIITFGAEPLIERPLAEDISFSSFQSLPNPHRTNIEAAVRLGGTLLPDEGSRRLVLISDGAENIGNLKDAFPALNARGVELDILPLDRRMDPEALIEELRIPTHVTPKEEFEVEVQVKTTGPARGELNIYRDGELAASSQVELAEGRSVISFPQQLAEGGFHRYRAELDVQPDTLRANNQAHGFVEVIGRTRILLIGDEQDASPHLISALEERDLQVVHRSVDGLPPQLEGLLDFDTVFLQDVSADRLSAGQERSLENYVRNFGGGLIASGGQNSFGLGNYQDSILESMLPVHSRLEQRLLFPTLSLLLVIDKSGSMADTHTQPGTEDVSRMDIAKKAAMAVLDLLVEEERIGITAFDVNSEVIVPMQPAKNRRSIARDLGQLEPGGGTIIYPSLVQAYEILKEEDSDIRHIILLSDGISEPGEYEKITDKMVEEGITMSTLAIGTDADRELLTNLAAWTGGEDFYTEDPDTVPQILVTETERMVRPAVYDKRFQPEPTAPNPFTRAIPWEQAPALDGLISTTPRQLADVFLKAPDRSPLLAGWRYGLGRTLAFTSDLGERWASGWLDWEDYGRFWAEAVEWTARSRGLSELTPLMKIENGRGQITVDAVNHEGQYLNFLDLSATVRTPEGDRLEFALEQTGPGRYAGSFPADRTGTYMASIAEKNGEGALSVGASVPYSPEYRELTGNPELLYGAAEATGGRILEKPEEVFAHRPLTLSRRRDIWPYFLTAALLLFLFDIGIRFLSLTGLMTAAGDLRNTASDLIGGLTERTEPLSQEYERKVAGEKKRQEKWLD